MTPEQAELNSLRAQLAEAQRDLAVWTRNTQLESEKRLSLRYRAQRDAALAQLERAREALTKIAGKRPWPHNHDKTIHCDQCIATAALSDQPSADARKGGTEG